MFPPCIHFPCSQIVKLVTKLDHSVVPIIRTAWVYFCKTHKLRYFGKSLPRTVQSPKSRTPLKPSSFLTQIDHGSVCESFALRALKIIHTAAIYNTKNVTNNWFTTSRTLPLLSVQSVPNKTTPLHR